MRTVIATDQAPAAIGPYSQAVRAGQLLFISGQIPLTAAGSMVEDDITAQTHQVLTNLRAIVEVAGLTMADVVKCTVFLADMGEFAAMNEVYARFFTDNPPARAAVEVSRLPKDVRVEIEAIVYAG